MKHFRIITKLLIIFIGLLVAVNICYLHRLYLTIKAQTIQNVNDCVRRADIIEHVMSLGEVYGTDKSHLNLVLSVNGEPQDDNHYSFPHLTHKFVEALTQSVHFSIPSDKHIKAVNYQILDSLFIEELHRSDLYPEIAFICPADSNITDTTGLWATDFYVSSNEPPYYTGYVSSLGSHVLKQMAGIVITSTLILLMTGVLIWYLLHTVGKLRTIEEMKDDFTHNMTHELKTPVAVAFSAADSMLRYYDQSDTERNKAFLRIIMQRLTHLSGLIENILSVSMERFKGMKLNRERVNVLPIVEEISGIIRLKSKKSVAVTINSPDEGVILDTDPLHFGNIISNLLDNAVKYSGETVNITVTLNHDRISVQDDGIGIKSSDIPYIFDKFYRVSNGDRYEASGYGLGLYYVKQVASLMNWQIDVKSKLGSGTIITIEFGKR
jgi:signal transduction histidine kinase